MQKRRSRSQKQLGVGAVSYTHLDVYKRQIAGSATDLMACVRVAVRDMGIPLDAAVRAASANPARALGLEGERGSIEVGKIADAVVLDENLRVRHVILRGELLG